MLLSSYALASVAVGVWYPLALDQKYQAWRPWRESPLWKVPSWKEVDGLKYPLSRWLPSVPAHAPSWAVGHVKLYNTAFPSGDSRCLSCRVGGGRCIESHVFNPYRLDFPLMEGLRFDLKLVAGTSAVSSVVTLPSLLLFYEGRWAGADQKPGKLVPWPEC